MNKLIIGIFLFIIVLACKKKERAQYELEDKELVPEGIAYSENTKAFYLTSVAKSKIIKVDEITGLQEDFIASGQDGFLPGVGILVDDKRGVVHALAAYAAIPDSLTSLFTFDLKSSKLKQRYSLQDRNHSHLLNDLILADDGSLYITDSFDSSVYSLAPDADSLKLFLRSNEIEFPNGIAISEDNSKLYVASFSKGVRIIDIATKTFLNKPDMHGDSQGIDGLEFYNGDLYGIQNGLEINLHNFRKLLLSPDQKEIVDVQVIDHNNRDLKVPLTFCINETKAVVIGNSNLESLDQKTLTFPEPDSLKRTKLLLYDLSAHTK